MAKWGCGDPRWIVEERPDAVNVNNWHWTEKNASQWSKDKLKELLLNLKIEDETGWCEITEITKIEGEASASNRKAKLIFFYEWTIKLEWKGCVNGSKTEFKGKIEIPNLSEENNPEDVDVTVTVNVDTKNSQRLKEMMRGKGTVVIREKIGQYIADLKQEFAQGMILPAKDTDTINGGCSSKSPGKTTTPNVKPVKPASDNTSGIQKLDIGGVRLNTGTITTTETFKCTVEELYNALTVKEMVQAFTQGPCKLETQKGGKFELFGRNVTGEFFELVPGKLIEQSWRFSNWPDGHYSHVTLNLEQKEDCTQLTLTQKQVPVSEIERTRDGWRTYYWESMRKTFGFGALLL